MTSYVHMNLENLTPRVAYSCIYRECRIQNAESTFYFKGNMPTLAVQTAIDSANQSWLDRNDVDGTTIGDYRSLPSKLIAAEKSAESQAKTELQELQTAYEFLDYLESVRISGNNAPISVPTKHYILMAGMRGYLPDFCEVFEDYEYAIHTACDLLIDDIDITDYDFNRAKESLANQLETTDSAYIDQRSYNLPYEYIEIQCCACDTPAIHSDTQ